MSSSNCCLLTCIQISQEADQVVWYSHLLKNFQQFVVIHTVKGFSSVQSLIHVRLFVTPWITAHQASLSITISRSSLKLMSIELVMPPCPSPTPKVHSNSRPLSWWCHPAISSCVIPFSSCSQSLPASESFPMSQLFTWGGQSTGASALDQSFQRNPRADLQNGLVGSPCSPRDSQESSPTPQFKSINSSVLSLLHSPTLTSIHDYWKNHSLD